jgi:hypothetical protein
MKAVDNRFTTAFGRVGEEVTKEELAYVVSRAVENGLAIVLCEPGGKKPVCTEVTPTARNKADREAQKAAKEAGRERWRLVKHECGIKHALVMPDLSDPEMSEEDRTALRNKARTAIRTKVRKVQDGYDDVLNIAVVPGRSGMVAVDIDTPDQLQAFWLAGQNASDLTVSSPGSKKDGELIHYGGGHIWFELPEGAETPPGSKYTGPGGWTVMWGENYVLVPPSRRPEGAYRFVSPEIRPVPEWLIPMMAGSPREKAGESGPKGPGDPIDEWEAGISWSELLAPDGWTSTGRTDSCGCPVWEAPGGRTEPKSATAHDPGCTASDTSTGHGPLHLWTDAPPKFLEGLRNVTKLQYVAARDHGGSVLAAMRALNLKSNLQPVPFASPGDPPEEDKPFTRIVDLGQWLDGDYKPPEPVIGAARDDDRQMLYPGKWHTVVGLTTAGKSWFALWHAQAVLEAGGSVVYVHFEEGTPAGTINRLLQLGVDREVIRERFVWLSNERMWQFSDMSKVWTQLSEQGLNPGLLVLDGLIAGASRQGWKVNDPETVAAYRTAYVTAAARSGAAVLSLGHPVKDRTRQDEIHSFGSTAWLDEVDGVSFRLVAGPKPIRKGHRGSSYVSVVKDREGSVIESCEIESAKSEIWYSLGELVMDDSRPGFGSPEKRTTAVWMAAPRHTDSDDPEPDKIDHLAESIYRVLVSRGGRYESVRALRSWLEADGVPFTPRDIEPALIRLEDAGKLKINSYRRGVPRGGEVVVPSGS